VLVSRGVDGVALGKTALVAAAVLAQLGDVHTSHEHEYEKLAIAAIGRGENRSRVLRARLVLGRPRCWTT
jgi:hypothetical protein